MNAASYLRNDGQKQAGQAERSTVAARADDSSAGGLVPFREFTAGEAARLARMEARPPVDLAADVAEERVAQALWDHVAVGLAGIRDPQPWESVGEHTKGDYRRLARAALAAMPPADETRERETVEFLQDRRRDALRALRASTDAGADYWRWQGHAELSRQLLERLGAEVPS